MARNKTRMFVVEYAYNGGTHRTVVDGHSLEQVRTGFKREHGNVELLDCWEVA